MSGLTEALHDLAARLDRADWSALLHDDHKIAHDGAVALEGAEARLVRAESIIAEKNKALGVAFNEMNAIRARDGAPQHIDWYKGRPLQTSSCTEEWFAQATDIISAALALRLDEKPTDAKKELGE